MHLGFCLGAEPTLHVLTYDTTVPQMVHTETRSTLIVWSRGLTVRARRTERAPRPEVRCRVSGSKSGPRRRKIPVAEARKVWLRSGACCAICGTYLLEGKLTSREFSLGELAHIVGQQNTPGSPRGQVRLPEEERDNADNLMLLCAGDHNEIDRGGAVDVFTVEKLRKIKQDHESWIRRVVGLSRNRTTVVLRMVGQLRGNAVELIRPTATDAVLRSSDRYPDFPLSYDQHGIEIDLRHVPGEATAASQYWASAAAIIDEVIDHRLKDGLVRERIQHLSVFAFARLPLLIYLGTKLDDTYPVAIYQRHRSTSTWDWPPAAPDTSFAVDHPADWTGNEAIVILNVSGSIQPDEIPATIRHLPVYWLRPDGSTPATDTISSPGSLAAFDRTVRTLLSTIEAAHKDTRRLHILAALPISAAVALGRARDPHVHPAFVLYDRDSNGYSVTLEIA